MTGGDMPSGMANDMSSLSSRGAGRSGVVRKSAMPFHVFSNGLGAPDATLTRGRAEDRRRPLAGLDDLGISDTTSDGSVAIDISAILRLASRDMSSIRLASTSRFNRSNGVSRCAWAYTLVLSRGGDAMGSLSCVACVLSSRALGCSLCSPKVSSNSSRGCCDSDTCADASKNCFQKRALCHV